MRTTVKLIFSIVFSFIILFGLELLARLFLTDYPDDYSTLLVYPSEKCSDKLLQYRHIPNWQGYATGVKVKINEAGLRDIPENEYKSKNLILYSGDSLFFGFGLQSEFAISNQLNNSLDASPLIYHLNCGVCGYNILQTFEHTKFLFDKYPGKIKYSFLSFIHNDINDLFQMYNSDDGIFSEIKSANFVKSESNNIKSKLLNLLLPDDIINLKFANKIGIRKLLLKYSKLYKFIVLNLKKINNSKYINETESNYILPELKISETLIYDPLEKICLEIKEYFSQKHTPYSVVILLDTIIENEPIMKIIEIFDKTGISYYNLAPLMPQKADYAKNYILGWDAHPNRKGANLIANILKKILVSAKILTDQESNSDEFQKEYQIKEKKYIESQKREGLKKFADSTLTTASEILFSDNYNINKHIIYGRWNNFPVKNDRINIRLDGVWTTKFLSIGLSSKTKLSKFKLFYDDFALDNNTRIFINKMECPYSVRTYNNRGIIEINAREYAYPDDYFSGANHPEYFYELYFEFGNCFKDEENRIFGPFIKKLEFK